MPKNLDSHEIYRLLDLAATQEDHGEAGRTYNLHSFVIHTHRISVYQTGNDKDYTMQAGRQKGSLPLMRRFNQHSERVLEQSL